MSEMEMVRPFGMEPQPRIFFPCPTCGLRSVFVGKGGHLTCSNLKCQNPHVEGVIERLLNPMASASAIDDAAAIAALPESLRNHALYLERTIRARIAAAEVWETPGLCVPAPKHPGYVHLTPAQLAEMERRIALKLGEERSALIDVGRELAARRAR